MRREAKALQSAGHQVSVLCPAQSRQPWHENLDGIMVYRFRPFTASSYLGYCFEHISATFAILTLSLIVLLREGFDVIHVGNPPDTIVPAISVYKLVGKRIIYDQHDLCPDLCAAKFANVPPLISGVLRWLERQSYTLADHVITTNESYRQIAITRGRIPESKITIVRNGPELQDFSCEIDSGLRSRSANLLLYTGRISVQDGLDVLCRILQELRYEMGRKEFCCVVMGDGDALPRVKDLAKKAGLIENICFTGWIDDSTTYFRYLNTADICVSPEMSNGYNDRSTFIKVMEYMAAGKPIVAFDLAETRFTARESALYARANDERDFAHKLAELMDNVALRRTMGEYGRVRIQEELDWQYAVPKLFGAYRQCMTTQKGLLRSLYKYFVHVEPGK